LGTKLRQEQFVELQEAYYRKLRWPAVAVGTLLALYLLSGYVFLPIAFKNEDLLLARRLALYASVVLATVAVAGFLFEDLSMVAATLGVVSAALVISLQDVCASIFGWFVIMLGGKFTVGDRLEVDGARGDVIDIQLLRTTLLEINGWLGVDQPTGRVIVLPNNFIFKTKVFNFTHGHPYIWGKVELTVTFSTPVATAQALFYRVLEEETREQFEAARQASVAMKKRYGIEDAKYEPKIYTTIGDSGVTFSLFYVADYRNSSATRNRLNRRLVAELEHNPAIQLAYNTLSVLHAQSPVDKPTALLGSENLVKVAATITATTTTMGTAPGLLANGSVGTTSPIPMAERVDGLNGRG
jgi:small-conductance mechanosensitive channel